MEIPSEQSHARFYGSCARGHGLYITDEVQESSVVECPRLRVKDERVRMRVSLTSSIGMNTTEEAQQDHC